MDAITTFCGSLAFVWVHALWFGAWIGENLLCGSKGFDSYPFPLLTLIVSLEAIFLRSHNRKAHHFLTVGIARVR